MRRMSEEESLDVTITLEVTSENRHRGCGREMLGQTVSRMRVMKCVKSKLGSDDSWKLFAVRVIGTAASIHCLTSHWMLVARGRSAGRRQSAGRSHASLVDCLACGKDARIGSGSPLRTGLAEDHPWRFRSLCSLDHPMVRQTGVSLAVSQTFLVMYIYL